MQSPAGSRPALPQGLADQPQLVGGGIDGEVPLVTEKPDLPAEDPHAERVEGGEDQILAALFSDQGSHTLLHLAGRLVGEGDRQDVLRRHILVEEEMGDPIGNHPGLAGAGAGQHQERPFGVLYRLKLAGVHGMKIEHVKPRLTQNSRT